MFALNLLRKQAHPIKRSFYTKAKFKDGGELATFNDMPIPSGSWKEAHTQKQKRYMLILVSGIASFIAASIFAATGDMEFNYTIPDYPYKDDE